MADHYHLITSTGKIIKHDHSNSRKPHDHAGKVRHSNTLKGIQEKQKEYLKMLSKHYNKDYTKKEDTLISFKKFLGNE